MLSPTSGQWPVAGGQLKPRLELRKSEYGQWEWWGLAEFGTPNVSWRSRLYILIGSARSFTLADALHVYRMVV